MHCTCRLTLIITPIPAAHRTPELNYKAFLFYLLLRCVLGNTTILAEFVSEEEVARYFAHSQAGGAEGAGSGGAAASGALGSSGSGTAVASSGGSSPGSERAAVGASSGGNGNGGAGGGGGGGGETGGTVLGSVRSSGSSWQNIENMGNPSETSSAQGSGLGIFSQWSTNGAGEGGGVGVAEPGRSGLWGGMTAGYPSSSSSLWGAPQMEERHQMDSPAGLLPGDLLGGGADSM